MNPEKKFEVLYNSLNEAEQTSLLNYILNTHYKISMEGINTGPNAKIILKEGINTGPNAKILNQREVCPSCGKLK